MVCCRTQRVGVDIWTMQTRLIVVAFLLVQYRTDENKIAFLVNRLRFHQLPRLYGHHQ